MPVILILVFSVIASNRPKTAHAADNNVANGITVDSTLDTPDPDPETQNPGDTGGGSNSNQGILANTGQTTLLTIAVASLLVLSASAVLSRRYR